jgi:Flp pilus assembly CpaE family ATPase
MPTTERLFTTALNNIVNDAAFPPGETRLPPRPLSRTLSSDLSSWVGSSDLAILPKGHDHNRQGRLVDAQPSGVMQIYFFTAGAESSELTELESRIRSTVPSLRKLANLNEVTSGGRPQSATSANHDQIYIIFPVLAATSFDRMANLAEQEHRGIFFIFISREISASDYKRLVRGGGADWVSMEGAPQEILDIISRTSRKEVGSTREEQARPAIVTFVPSSGGVGNVTLAIETAVQIKRAKQTRSRRVCLLDLDLQASHVCDYLDIEPRLNIEEINQNPDRLDAQLFDLFVSRHVASGVDVLAMPRSRRASVELNMAALEALFRYISVQYDLVIVNVPPAWFDWTDQILSVCDLAIVTGLNSVPGLRRIAETLQEIKSAERVPSQVVVALNRCESGLVGGVARRGHVSRALGNQTVLFVREDTAAAYHSLNTGVPISMASRSSKITKDVRALASLVSALRLGHAHVTAAPRKA